MSFTVGSPYYSSSILPFCTVLLTLLLLAVYAVLVAVLVGGFSSMWAAPPLHVPTSSVPAQYKTTLIWSREGTAPTPLCNCCEAFFRYLDLQYVIYTIIDSNRIISQLNKFYKMDTLCMVCLLLFLFVSQYQGESLNHNIVYILMYL